MLKWATLVLALSVAFTVVQGNCGLNTCQQGSYCCRSTLSSYTNCYWSQPSSSSYKCSYILSSSFTYNYFPLSIGAIVGIVISGLFCIGGGIVACVFCCCRNNTRNQGRVIGQGPMVTTTTTQMTQPPGGATNYAYSQQPAYPVTTAQGVEQSVPPQQNPAEHKPPVYDTQTPAYGEKAPPYPTQAYNPPPQ